MATVALRDDDATLTRDKALVRMIAATALRQCGLIRHVLAKCLDKPLTDRAIAIEPHLIAGACELLFLDSAAHGVVDSHVELAKNTPSASAYAKLVNGVLRRIDREKPSLLAGIDAAELNTPAWLFTRWQEAYGPETARAIADAHGAIPPLDLTVPRDLTDWAEKLGGAPVGQTTLRLVNPGPVEKLEGYDRGAWWVQDVAAALPALLLHAKPGEVIADLCAAPGGKTAQLCAAGATVHAVDLSKGRLKRLRANMERLRFAPAIHQADGLTWTPPEPLDAVLLDAPCSATGTIRRNPDVPWLKSETDIKTLTSLQARLLRHTLSILRPGGRMIYCTCSLEPEEGEQQIANLLSDCPHVKVDAIDAAETVGLEHMINADGTMRILPTALHQETLAESGAAGFFIARLRKC